MPTMLDLDIDGFFVIEYKKMRQYIYEGKRYYCYRDEDTKEWQIFLGNDEKGLKCEFIGCNQYAFYIQNNKRCCRSHLVKIFDKKGNVITPTARIGGGH